METAASYGSELSRRGRKSSWNSPTKMIRLPERFEGEIIAYARQLDDPSDPESEIENFESKLQRHINAVLMTVPPPQRRSAAKLFNKLIDRLKAEG